MRLHGYCTSCRRIRRVLVSSRGMAMLAHRRVAEGICSECEEAERNPFELVVQRGRTVTTRLRRPTLASARAEAARFGRDADNVEIVEHRRTYPFSPVARYDAEGKLTR